MKRLKQEQNVNKWRVDEFRIIEPMEETDYCERVPDNELTTIKNEPCEDDVIYIEEPEENEEKFFESSLCTLRLRPAAMTRGRSCWRPATTGKGLENKSVCLSVIPEHLTRF